jgi:hypothetical protein
MYRVDRATPPGAGSFGTRLVLVALALAVVKLLLGPYALIDDDVHHLFLDYRKGFAEYLTPYAEAPHFRLRPLPFLSLWIEGAWLRLPPDAMHYLSLAWVGAGALAIGSFAERLARSRVAGTLAALLAVAYPVQCEVEGWVSARFDAMAVAFTAMALAVEARRASGDGVHPRSRFDGWLAPALYGLALLSKESTLVFLPVFAAVPWLFGRGGAAVAGAAVRHGLVLGAVLVLRLALMGRLVGSEALEGNPDRWGNLFGRLQQLALPLKTETAWLPPALLGTLFALALATAAAAMVRRAAHGNAARVLGFLAIGLFCCEVPISSSEPGPDLQDPRLLSLFLTCLVPALAWAGRIPLAALLVASSLIMPGNLRAYREAYAIHGATVETLRVEVGAHSQRIFVQGLPPVRSGVKLFFGSVVYLREMCSPEDPWRIVAVPDMSRHAEAVGIADDILAGYFAQAAAAGWPIRRLVFDPAKGRPVFRDLVHLRAGESLIPGSSKHVPDFGER